jgi:uncharacterized tellurite resistance protein B-like protein
MATFAELMQQFVNMSYNQLLSTANQAFAELSEHLEEYFEGAPDYSTRALLMLTASCLGIDGTLSPLERRFINDLLNARHSSESLNELITAYCNNESVELVDRLADTLDSDGKTSLLVLAICILSVDETISREEVTLIKKLLQ